MNEYDDGSSKDIKILHCIPYGAPVIILAALILSLSLNFSQSDSESIFSLTTFVEEDQSLWSIVNVLLKIPFAFSWHVDPDNV